MKRTVTFALICASLLSLTPACNRNPLTGSKLTRDNYDQVANGMTKSQVERIMGPPTTTETKDMLVFKKTTYRYEEGSKFALFSFKNAAKRVISPPHRRFGSGFLNIDFCRNVDIAHNFDSALDRRPADMAI